MPLKLLLLTFFALHAAFAVGWDDVQRISSNQKIQVVVRAGNNLNATFVSAGPDSLVIRTKSGEQLIARPDIRIVRVADPSRRGRNGLLATGAGAAIGLAIGFAVCVYCSNEGNGAKYTVPLTALGAGVGALGFLGMPYRTVYRVK